MKLKEFIKSVEKVQLLNEKLGNPMNTSFTFGNITRTKPDTSGPKLGGTSTTQKLIYKSNTSGAGSFGINPKKPTKLIEIKLPKYGMTGIADVKKLTKEFMEFEVVRTVRDMWNGYNIELEDKLTKSEEDAYAAALIRRAKKAKAVKSPRLSAVDYKDMITNQIAKDNGFIRDQIESRLGIEFTTKVNKVEVSLDFAAPTGGKDIMRVNAQAEQVIKDAPYTLLSRLYTPYAQPQVHMPPPLTHRFTKANMEKQVSDFLARPMSDRYASVIHLITQASRRSDKEIHDGKVGLYKEGYIKSFKGIVGPKQNHVEISKELEEEWVS